jgi:hypothetical protein
MPRCEACGEEAGKDITGEGRRFCKGCVEKPVITQRYVGCGHLVGNEDDTCPNCKRSLKSGTGMTYNPGMAGGVALDADGEVVMVKTVKADELPRRG